MSQIFTGQADGLAPRSFEVLHSLGLKKMLDETQPLGGSFILDLPSSSYNPELTPIDE